MDEQLSKIGVLLAFALVMLVLNLRATGTPTKFVSFMGMWAALIGAGVLTVQFVI